MKNGVAFKNKNLYLKVNIYFNEESILPLRPMLPLYKNQINGIVSIQ